MRRAVLHITTALSFACLAVAALWLILVTLFLLSTGGTYSRTFADGSIACGIPVGGGREMYVTREV
jgi:hypothetical protein